jgi:hypothetical protein
MSRSPRRGDVVLIVLAVIGLICWRTWARSFAGAKPEKPPPGMVDVRYGPDARHVLDVWKAIPRMGQGSPTPPVILFYSEPNTPLPANAKPGAGIHHPRFGTTDARS